MATNGHRPGRHIRSRHVAVARTIVEPQPDLSAFLDAVGRQLYTRLGRGAIVSTLGGLHMTMLEGAGTVPEFRQRGFTPQDVHGFYVDLQQHLQNIQGTRECTIVEVDPRRPVVLCGRYAHRLAIHFLPSEPLRRERGYIEEFLAERFGSVPAARPFDEHVTFATLPAHALRPSVRRNPESLLPGDVTLPETVAVNGLAVYLSGIGDSQS